MRIPMFLTVLGASTLALAAHAQEALPAPPADQPVQSQPAQGTPVPADGGTTTIPGAPAADASAPPPPPPAAYNAAPESAPPAPVMAQAAPVVQNVAPPPAEYPVCSKTVRDACRNPGSK